MTFTSSGVIEWIDVCQNDGNMLTAGGFDNNVKMVDKKESKIVQTFDGIHQGNIFLFNHSLLLIAIK